MIGADKGNKDHGTASGELSEQGARDEVLMPFRMGP